jgi:hypothetical protein
MGISLMKDSIALYSYHETGKTQLETKQSKYMIVFLTPALSKGEGGIQNSRPHPSLSRGEGNANTSEAGPSNGGIPKGENNVSSPSAIYKYIFTADFKQEELYELISDPGENSNLSTTNKPVLEQMRAKAKQEMKRKFGIQ